MASVRLRQRRHTARAVLTSTIALLLGVSLAAVPEAWGGQSAPARAAGAHWHRKAVPFPSDWQKTLAPDTLTSVSCGDATSCIAVGEYNNGFAYVALVERWDGTRWSSMLAPAPATSRPYRDYVLQRVSCPATNWCLAVGYFNVYGSDTPRFPNGVRSYPYAALYNGTGWEGLFTDSLKLNDGEGGLAGVSCPQEERCDVAGYTSRHKHRGSMFRFDAAGFTRLGPVPMSGGFSSQLSDLSCASAGHCQATVDGAKIGIWNGHHWKLHKVSRGKTLDDIDCPTAKTCVAVGGTTTGGAGTSTHSELWARHRWRTIPKKRDHARGLDKVSCPTTKTCYTVGGYYRPYVARWKGGRRWTIAKPSIPKGYYAVRMTALDCPTARFCMGVGELDPNSTTRRDGLTSWSFTP